MKNRILHRSLSTCVISSLAFLSADCGPPVTCGTGTKLDEETNECVADVTGGAGFNAGTTVTNVQLKNLTINSIEIPTEIVLGTPSRHTITVTNGQWPQPVVTLRLHALEASATDVEKYLTTIGEWYPFDQNNPRCRYGGVTGECHWSYHFNGVCDDGGPNSSSSSCPLGADCYECGARNYDPVRCADPNASCLVSCESDAACGTGFFCNTVLEECHIRPSQIAEINIVDLAANESRTITFDVDFPRLDGEDAATDTWLPKQPDTSKSYRVVLTAHEQLLDFTPAVDNSCTTDDDCVRGTQRGTCTQGSCSPGKVTFKPMAKPWWVPPKFLTPLHGAFARVLVKTDATATTAATPLNLSLRIPPKPTLDILDVTFDRYAWELDESVTGESGMFNVRVRAMLRGPSTSLGYAVYPPGGKRYVHSLNTLSINASMNLPKMYFNHRGSTVQQSEAAKYGVPLRIKQRAGTSGAGYIPAPPAGQTDTRADQALLVNSIPIDPATIEFNEPFDVTFSVHFMGSTNSFEQVKRFLAQYKQDGTMNAMDELATQISISMRATSTRTNPYNGQSAPYNDSWLYATKNVDTVFLPPEAPKEGLTPVTSIGDTSDPTEYASQRNPPVYEDADDITPTYRNSFGGSWLGAEMQILNTSSKERKKGAVVKQALNMDNYFRANFLKRQFTILSIRGGFDWGSQRLPQQNKANGELAMASFTSCTSALTAALAAPFGCGIGAAGLAGIIWEPSDTVFSFTYDPGDDCEEDDDGRTICWIIAPDGGACTVGGLGGAEACEPELFSEVSFGDATLTANSISVSTEKEKKKLFTIGPIPFEVVGKISGTLGIKASLGIFFREFDDDDPTSNNESFAGVIASVGPFASVDLAAEGAAILGLFRIGIEGSITLISVDLLPTVELGIAQRLREDGECWMKNTGRVEFTGPATLELASGSVGIAAYFGIKDFCFLGWCEDLSVKIFSFTIFSWDAPFTRTWNLWHVVEEFGSGDGLCPFGDIPPMDWRSPVGCTSWTGADAYCPGSGTTNGLAVHVYEPSFSTYRETFYAGASGCATLVVNGNVWPNSMEAPAGAWRDALVVNARPLTTRRYHYATTALEGNKYYDANFRQFNDYTGWFHNPSGYATTIPEQPKEASAQGCFLRNSVWPSYGCVGTTNGPWSGQFTDTRIRICSRLIDVHLRTFGVAPGVAIRLETDEGREREIFSDTKWQVSHVTNATGDRNPVNNSGQRVWSQFHEQMNWDGWVSPQNYVFPGGYAAAPWYSGTPPAPFANDGSKMNWMSGWRTEGLDPNSVVNGYTYYRRVFIADAELYDLHARCDNRCDIYLDGQLIHTTGDWNQPSNITVTTVPGRMHLLGVALYNADAVKGVGAFTLGMKAR